MAKLDLFPSRMPVRGKDLPRSHLGLREKPWSKRDLFQESDRYVSRRFAPAGVLINPDWEILQFRGETEPYLKQAAGEASFSLMKMAREGLVAGLHSALQESLKQNRQVKRENLRLEHNGRIRTIDVEVVPLKLGPGGERYFLVLFKEARETITPPPLETEPAAEAPGPKGQDGLLIRQLREELAATKEYLQATIEDLESALNFVNEIFAGVRHLSRNLRPPVLDLGLPKALKILFEEFGRYHGLELTLDLDDIEDLFSWETQIL